MRKTILILAALFALVPCINARNRFKAASDSLRAHTDTLSAEFLDTVNIKKSKTINDYSMLGVNYGVTFSTTSFNPTKRNREMVFTPNYASIMYTHYEKMFGYIQNFGITVGMEYGHEGYSFKEDENGRTAHVDSALFCSMTLIDIPAMAQFHFSAEPLKFMVDLGIYGGYRYSVERTGLFKDKEYAYSFRSYENRWDYGLKGGVGVALLLDPIEIHLNCHVRWSWSSLYQPNYSSQYYYKFAYPLDIMASIGIHYQLTKRHGKTNGALRREAKEIVYGPKKKTPIKEDERAPKKNDRQMGPKAGEGGITDTIPVPEEKMEEVQQKLEAPEQTVEEVKNKIEAPDGGTDAAKDEANEQK